MRNFFDLKRIRYNLCGNYLMKLLDTSTCRYGTQALCFKGSLLWNKIPKKYKNLNFLELKSQMKQWDPTTCSCKICKQANFIIFVRDCRQILLMMLGAFEWIIRLLYLLNHQKIIDFLMVLGEGRSLTGLVELV